MADNPKITLRAIAEQTGVTRMAVSLALRGKKGVSEATRRNVMKAARKLGYVPDPDVSKFLSHIRRKRPSAMTSCIALLTSGTRADDWRRYTTERKYVEGAHARAREYGYRVESFWLNEPGMTMDRLGGILWNRGIEGVVIAPLQERLSGTKERAVRIDYSLFCVVEISETVAWPDLDRAIHDQYTAMLKCLHELAALGYSRIGYVIEEALDLRVNGKWTAAYLRHRQVSGARDMPPALILPGPNQAEFNRWMEKHRPDAIISVDRFGLRLATAAGLSMPRDVGYASLDLDGDITDVPGMSGIDQNSNMVGAAAVDMVVAAIQRGQRGIPVHPMRTEVEGTWVQGTTVSRRKAEAG